MKNTSAEKYNIVLPKGFNRATKSFLLRKLATVGHQRHRMDLRDGSQFLGELGVFVTHDDFDRHFRQAIPGYFRAQHRLERLQHGIHSRERLIIIGNDQQIDDIFPF